MFKTALESILERTEGSLGALIMGTDGIAVEQVVSGAALDSNLDVAATEVTTLVRSIQRMGQNINLGALSEFTLSFGNATILVRTLNKDYFLVLILDPASYLGRGRFELRKAELDFAREFVV